MIATIVAANLVWAVLFVLALRAQAGEHARERALLLTRIQAPEAAAAKDLRDTTNAGSYVGVDDDQGFWKAKGHAVPR